MDASSTETPPVVLVVDDDALLRMNAADFLKDAGFKTVEAENAADALKIMETRSDVRILFTDVQMPGSIDGIELAKKIHANWPEVLLLITSGNACPSKRQMPDHGHFLSKPYRAAALVGEIHALAREAAARGSH